MIWNPMTTGWSRWEDRSTAGILIRANPNQSKKFPTMNNCNCAELSQWPVGVSTN
jgi:hypothetical protein